MRQSEIGGLIAWALTLGLATLGLSTLLRSRRERRATTIQRVYTALAMVASGWLAAAGIVVWVNGARGQYYDALVDPLWWSLAMLVGLVGGALIGWRLPTGR